MAGPIDAVDLLFVIDESMSMASEQAKLAAALPIFFAELTQAMPTISFHIAAISGDDMSFNATGLNLLPCAEDQSSYSEISGSLSPEELAELLCRTEIGLLGDVSEKPVQSMLMALEQSTGGINGDFLRPDALLTVIMVTDEDDDIDDNDGSIGDPQEWAEDLMAFKGGEASAVASFMLIGQAEPNACDLVPLDEPNLPNPDLLVEAEPAIRLGAFAELLPGFDEDVCVPTYAEFFTEVTGDIEARTQ